MEYELDSTVEYEQLRVTLLTILDGSLPVYLFKLLPRLIFRLGPSKVNYCACTVTLLRNIVNRKESYELSMDICFASRTRSLELQLSIHTGTRTVSISLQRNE
jgi:hypothetical protein